MIDIYCFDRPGLHRISPDFKFEFTLSYLRMVEFGMLLVLLDGSTNCIHPGDYFQGQEPLVSGACGFCGFSLPDLELCFFLFFSP